MEGKRRRRWWAWLVVPVAAGLGLVGLVLAIGLIGVAATRSGRLAGWAALAWAVVAIHVAGAIARPELGRGRWRNALIAEVVAGVGLTGILVAIAPDGASTAGASLRSRWIGPARFRRFVPMNWVPEGDQARFGAALISRLDPWMERRHGRRLRRDVDRLYRELEAQPGVERLGTVQSAMVAEVLGLPFAAGHTYEYVPAPRPGERLGLIVFLHGNGGNFKLMPWLWAPLADRDRFAIVAPSFGFGLWDDGGVAAVERALDDALARLPIDSGRVYLAGLSDGGKGVTRAAMAGPSRYAGLIYVSPTMIVEEIDSPEFRDGWAGRPVFVLHGTADHNVSPSSVDRGVAALERRGVAVEYALDDGEDHFLFMGRRAEALDRISGWLGRARREPTSGP